MPTPKDILDEKRLKDLSDAEFKAVMQATGTDYAGAIRAAARTGVLLFMLEIQKDAWIDAIDRETFEKLSAGIKSMLETLLMCVERLRPPAGPPEAAAGKMP